MRISARCEYACKAILELALHWPNKQPLQVHVISERQKIPLRYLIQILIQLKKMGIVASCRGKGGGYNLALAPEKISLGKVMREVGGPLLSAANSTAMNGSAFAAVWKELEGTMAAMLDKATFAQLVQKAKGRKNALMYHI